MATTFIPCMNTHIEGMDTVWINAGEIARALNKEVYELATFFAFEMGVSATFELNEHQDRVVIAGVHSDAALKNCLAAFVDKANKDATDKDEAVEDDCPTCLPALGLDDEEFGDEGADYDDDWDIELQKRII